MAEFCKQCTLEVWGDYPSDFVGITTHEDVAEGMYAWVLCESCGHIPVDVDGSCVGENCCVHGKDPTHDSLGNRIKPITIPPRRFSYRESVSKQIFRCVYCGKTSKWEYGAHDDMPQGCDDCWLAAQGGLVVIRQTR